MRTPRLSVAGLLIVVAAAAWLPAAEPAGVAVGWGSADGTILLQELNCVACHAGQTDLLAKQAPRLSEAGSRITPQYLRKFLAAPQLIKPGTPMPHLLHGMAEQERGQTVEALVHFLVSQGGPIDQFSSGSSEVQIDRGRALFHRVGCVACHPPIEPPPKHKTDPATAELQELLAEEELESGRAFMSEIPLGELASKTTVEQLAKFLDDPLHVRPSGRMPGLNLKPGEARFIAAYLLREQYTEGKSAPGPGLDVAYYEGNWTTMPEFSKLQPVWQGEAKKVEIEAVQLPDGKKPQNNFAVRFEGQIVVAEDGEYRFWTTSDDGTMLYIDEKLVVSNDGQHPPQEAAGKIRLSAGSHLFRLGFTQGGGGFELAVQWQAPGGQREPIPAGVFRHNSPAAMIPHGVVDFQVDPALASRGRELFAQLGCASCHEIRPNDQSPAIASKLTAKPLAELASVPTKGCLSPTPAAKTPQFALSASQREAIAHALPRAADTTPDVAHTLASFSCYACHQRGEAGGPSVRKSEYFTYEILVDWGEEGRMPPAIHEVGAKLTEAGFDDMLFAGKRYRPYMATRMPQYGKQNIGHLPEQFRLADENKVPTHEPQFSPRMVDDGRQLVGKANLACINCHAWGELRLQGAEGLDLLEVPRRLQPGWFHALLQDPQVLRPRTRMPTAFPEGKSFFPDIQDGDMHKQIDSLWAYLSVGRKGGPPPGLTPGDETLLTPTDEPITFRTFLDGYSSHAILVGFRQRTHLAFDANRVKSVAAWTGDFISAKPSWEGRAGQYAAIPSADVVKFPAGPAFARLPSITEPWPADLPRQRLGSSLRPEGWLFRGYRFDEQRVPTFLYRFDDIQIEETPGTGYRQNEALLTRSFKLASASKVDDLYLILARGAKIVEEGGGFSVDDRLRYHISGTPAAEPYIRQAADHEELLLPIRFSAAPNSTYQAEVEVELTW
jgi:cytochrome c2